MAAQKRGLYPLRMAKVLAWGDSHAERMYIMLIFWVNLREVDYRGQGGKGSLIPRPLLIPGLPPALSESILFPGS